jgi:hypothetical protein
MRRNRLTRTRSGLRVAVALAILFACFFPIAVARAEPTRAETLFSEASTLMVQERHAEAIPKLIEAQRLDPGIGTQFNIALCYEKLGRLGSAWWNYSEVERLAKASGKKPREDAARQKLEALRPRLMVFVLVPADPEDISVKVDGTLVGREDWRFYPVDPGSHVVQATAPAKKPWTKTLGAPAEGGRLTVDIPILEVAKEERVVTVTKETTNNRRTIGFIAGGIGVASAIAAAVTGILLLDDVGTAEDDCQDNIPGEPGRKRCRTDTGRDAVKRAEILLPINAAAWGVAALGIGVGTYFLLTSGRKPESTPPKTAILPLVGRSNAGLCLTHRF